MEKAIRTESNAPAPQAVYSWRAHPARERPIDGLTAFVTVLAVAAACGWLGGLWWGVVAFALLVASLSRFFFPSRFVADHEGVTASYLLSTQHRRWPEIRRIGYDAYGIYLGECAARSRWDAYRGVHLLFGRAREEVLCEVRARLATCGDTT